MELLRTAHPIKIKEPLAYNGVVVEDLIELAQLEKEYFVKILALDLPVLFHGRCEIFPFLLGNV
jgi:hypothetical protein